MVLGPLALVRAAVELAEAEVAVGDEGAHAEFRGQGQRSTFDGYDNSELAIRFAQADLAVVWRAVPTMKVALGTLGLPEPVAREMTAAAGFTRFTVRDFGNPFYEVRP
jgi:hypothetical protein